MKNEKAGAFGALNIDGEIFSIEKVVASSEKDDPPRRGMEDGVLVRSWFPSTHHSWHDTRY